MSSVTRRIKEVKQPRGGFIKPSAFSVFQMYDGCELRADENVAGSVIGMAVDYLTRFMTGASADDAFCISLRGAKIAEACHVHNAFVEACELLAHIKGLDDGSVAAACKLVTFDVWLRDRTAALLSRNAADTNPDGATIENLRIMIKRSLAFWEQYGPVVQDGFTFGPNGYTVTVDSGDGDYLTSDTLWDFKVVKSKLTSAHTLQLLMYWIMGQHSGQDIFKSIANIGVFNPRQNVVYLLDMHSVSKDVIKIVERDVICY